MFCNKVVIVTGGSAGIGAGIAECFAKEGASLAIVGRNETKLKNVAQRCEDLGAKVLVIKADVSIEKEAKTIVQQAVDKFGKLDVLVNNAGILKFGAIEKSDILQIYDEVINTNLRSIINITNLAVPHLKETKGSIINVSSVAAKKVTPGMSAYCISKAGLDQFTKCAAIELAAYGIRVNSVNPGPVTSDMLTSLDIFLKETTVKNMTVLGRNSEAKEVGDLILYLASDKAKGITGSKFVIDNGLLLL